MHLNDSGAVFLTETESSGLLPGVNSGEPRWTRRLMQEKSDNQSVDQPRAGESLVFTSIDAVCSSRSDQQTLCSTSSLFSVVVGNMENIFYRSVCKYYIVDLYFNCVVDKIVETPVSR